MRYQNLLLLLMAIILAGLCQTAQADVLSGLVAHYPFDGNARDTSKNGYDGTVNGATVASDRFNYGKGAFYFDGVNDTITVPQDQFVSGNVLTVSLWLKVRAATTGVRYFMMCSDFGVWQHGGEVGLAISHPATESAGGVVPGYNQWIHFLGTFDGTNIRAYINGQLVDTYYHPGDLYDLNYDLAFGVFNSEYWQGTLDDVRIYDRVLTGAEIMELANSIHNIQFSPVSPATLDHDERVNITFDYVNGTGGDVLIFARPFSGGNLSPFYAADGSPDYPVGGGSGAGYFTITEGLVAVDQVRFQMKNVAQTVVYLEKFLPAEYYFPAGNYVQTEDVAINSKWADTPPTIDGTIAAGEWNGASSIPMYNDLGWEAGRMYLLNDDTSLYVLLDFVADTVAGSTTDDDYTGISVDINLDEQKTPYVDFRYTTPIGSETLGLQRALSDTTWTGVGPTLSEVGEGFGLNPMTADPPHTIFEYRLDYAELGIDYADLLANPADPFRARIIAEMYSNAPSIEVSYPSPYSGPWSVPMIRIGLDIGDLEVDPNGPIVAGIGLVPRNFIDQDNGLATTGAEHQINVLDAPFGSHLRVIGNVDKLRGEDANYYAIGYCDMSQSSCPMLHESGFSWSDWTFVTDTKTNYYWSTSLHKYVLDNVGATLIESSGPAIMGYPVQSAGVSWYFPNLLFDWRTTGTVKVNSGMYKMHVFGFANLGLTNLLTHLDDEECSMVVRIDNTAPVMTINSISYQGADVPACGIVELASDTDDLVLDVSAFDPDGYLYNYVVEALYGDNQRFTCSAESYPGSVDGLWYGLRPNGTVLCEGDGGTHWETTCAYAFRVSGYGRAINGYSRIHYRSYHKTMTILMPDYVNPNDQVELEDVIRDLRVLTGN